MNKNTARTLDTAAKRPACPGVGLKNVPTIHEFTGYRMCPVCGKEVAADFRTGGLRWHAQLPQAAKKETR